jgi:F420H(2)-dependent quinone reductase
MHELAAAAVNRVISALSRSQPALRGFIRVLSWAHLVIYRLTRGRLTTRLGLPGAEMILLTSTGRKTGKPRTVPLLSVRRGDDWLVIASNAGLDRPPGWWFNLRANPAATVRSGPRSVPVVAKVADDAARCELWPLFVREYAGYADYQQRASRIIPILILQPVPRDQDAAMVREGASGQAGQ